MSSMQPSKKNQASRKKLRHVTLASQNGARHTIDGTTYLGNSVNGETDGQPNFQAGSTDDDGVTFPKSGTTNILLSGQSNTITVNASVAGKLNAWIDWNQDGQWQASEQIATDVSLTAGSNTLPITVANTYSHGVTYARFRFSTQSGLQPTRSASNGEVEDYKVNIVAPSPVACSVGLINGGFESPATQTQLDNLSAGIFSYREAFYPGWSFRALNPSNPAHPSFPSSSAFDQRNAVEIWPNGALGKPAAAGNYFAEVNAYAQGNLYQDIQTVPGTVLSWKFSHRGRSGKDTLQLKIGRPGSTVQMAQATTDDTGWKTYTGTYTIPPGQNITRFEFEAVSTSNNDTSTGNFIDDVSFGLDCSNPADVRLVKRITAINSNSTQNPNDSSPLNQVLNSPSPNDDPGLNWPNGYLIGAYSAGLIKPGDEIEYTVYFMNAKGSDATSVKLCDRIVGAQQFLADAYGTGKDIEYKLGTNAIQYLTKASLAAVDGAEFNPSTSAIAGCPAPTITGTNNGTVVFDVTGNTGTGQVNITALPGATTQGTPNSYGYFRFKVKVDP